MFNIVAIWKLVPVVSVKISRDMMQDILAVGITRDIPFYPKIYWDMRVKVILKDILNEKNHFFGYVFELKSGRCTGFDKMSKVFHFWVNSTILKRISNSIQNFTGFGQVRSI